MLGNGYHDVPPGKVASVVTHLEMRTPATLRPAKMPDGIELVRFNAPEPEWYRDLFRRVGGLDWLWFSRLGMGDQELTDVIGDPKVEVYAVMQNNQAKGLLELDLRQGTECELAFFGVSAELIGTGVGRFMMNEAITRAWAHPITRFHVHTCSLDSPAALGFYRRSGFIPTRQQIEIEDDPRLSGSLPETAGTHIPIFR